MRLECGDTFCQPCVENLKLEGNKCKICQEEIIAGTLGKDIMINLFLEEISVYCKNSQGGCKWQGAFKDYEDHLKNACKHKADDPEDSPRVEAADGKPRPQRRKSPERQPEINYKQAGRRDKVDKRVKGNKKKK